MATKDPRVDAYIAKSATFAKPVLRHLRRIVLATCPDAEETLKWGSPTFMHHGILCGMAAFKAHCVFGFWKGSLVVDDAGRRDDAMGQFGRITKVSDLPSERVIAGYVRQAMTLNEDGVRARPRKPPPRKPIPTPADLRAALAKRRKALATFEAFPPSHRREYVEWIVEAKRPETRRRRIEQAVAWMAEGKSRNWKYEPKS